MRLHKLDLGQDFMVVYPCAIPSGATCPQSPFLAYLSSSKNSAFAVREAIISAKYAIRRRETL